MQFRLITAILASTAISGVVASSPSEIYARDEQNQQADPPAGGLPGGDIASKAIALADSSAPPPPAAAPAGAASGGFFGGGNFGGLVPDSINITVQPPPSPSPSPSPPPGPDCSQDPTQMGCAPTPWNDPSYCYTNYYAPGCPGYFPGRFPPIPAPADRPLGCPVYIEDCSFCRFGPVQYGPPGWGQPQFVCPNQFYGYPGCQCFYGIY